MQRAQRHAAAMLLAVVLVASLVSCAPMRQGADAFLTRSEQSLDVAFWSVDALFRVERATPELDQLVPGSHAAIDRLRPQAKQTFYTAMNAMDAYRLSKGEKEKAGVMEALAVAMSIGKDAEGWLTKISAAKGAK